jgi:DNA-binding response OmpR family regulator
MSRGPGLDIIVADDQPDAAESLALVLQLEGHDVRIALDGLQAQAEAVARRPDLMVLDIGMPGATGDQVARWVRSQPWGSQVRLVAVTGWGRPEDQARLKAAGFDIHLVKPVAVERLVAEINRGAAVLPSAEPTP